MENAGPQVVGSDSGSHNRPARPKLGERREYVSLDPREDVIVPLLRREIETCVELYATPARGKRKAVDLGCGGQPFRTLLESIGYSYCGVDADSTEGVADIVWAVDEALPQKLIDLGPFDFALCTELLEHVADWGTAFANFRKLLAPGGRLLITVPHFFNLHEEPYDFWRPTLHAIDYYARGNGFHCLQRRAAGDAWDVLGVLLPNCRFVASSDAISKRVAAKAVRAAARWTFQALLRRKLQRWVQAEGPLYLSNVVVLETSERS